MTGLSCALLVVLASQSPRAQAIELGRGERWPEALAVLDAELGRQGWSREVRADLLFLRAGAHLRLAGPGSRIEALGTLDRSIDYGPIELHLRSALEDLRESLALSGADDRGRATLARIEARWSAARAHQTTLDEEAKSRRRAVERGHFQHREQVRRELEARRTWGLITGGAGVAAFGFMALSFGLAHGHADQIRAGRLPNSSAISREADGIITANIAGTALGIGGGALTALGGILFFTALDPGPYRMQVVLGPSGAQFMMVGAW